MKQQNPNTGAYFVIWCFCVFFIVVVASLIQWGPIAVGVVAFGLFTVFALYDLYRMLKESF